MPTRICRLLILLVAVMLCDAVSLDAQVTLLNQGASADDPIQVTTRLVVLDVVVVDRNGNFVANYDASKFHVFEDKAPQRIRNFDPPDRHQMPLASVGKAIVHSSADLDKIGNAPVNILVIDELNTPYMQIAYSQQMMERYLKKQPEVLPVPTLFLAAGASRVAVLHDYTQSRAELIDSIHKHVTEADFNVLANTLNGGRKGAVGGMGRTLGALSQIAAGMKGFPGRKNLIWVGTGYKRSGDGVDMTNRESSQVLHAIQTVTNRMLAAHIVLYTIDPEGVAHHSDTTAPAGSSMDSEDAESLSPNVGFESFAYSTGGRVLFGRNDVETEVRETTSEGSMYYTLAYVPSNSAPTPRAYRRIKVTVDDPSMRVITRDGYFGEEHVVQPLMDARLPQPKAVAFDLVNAARTTMVYTGLHSDAVRTANGYSLQVRASDLQWNRIEDGSLQSEVTILAICYTAKGKELMQHAAELKERIEATDRIDNGVRVGFAFPLALPPGTARVRFVLRDAGTGTMGSVNAAP